MSQLAVAWPSDVARYTEAIERAATLAGVGRHAVAERMLRECMGALVRRRALAAAAEGGLVLGRLLIERGRARDAEAVCGEAADHAQLAGDVEATLRARLWQSVAQYDAGRFVDAASLCRMVLDTAAGTPAIAAWAHAVLTRVRLRQERLDEAAVVAPLPDGECEPIVRALVDAVAVKVLVRQQHLFDAGQRSEHAVEAADASGVLLARVIAHTAYLRVLAEAGDLTSAAVVFAHISTLVGLAHTPLRIARARLVWFDALRRAGRAREADGQLHRLVRVRAVAPAALRQSIERRLARHASPARERRPSVCVDDPPAAKTALALASSLARITHEASDDGPAVRTLLERIATTLQACRVDLLSDEAGAVSPILTVGDGALTSLGGRVLEAGMAIGPEEEADGQQVGVVVRADTRPRAAIVARWPQARRPPAHAEALLMLAAVLVAPHVDEQHAAARLAAAAAQLVPSLIGVSHAMGEVRRAIVRAAAAPFGVLIEGESGCGKELVARAIHDLSGRRGRRWCDLNCAAIPEDLLDAELFGHVRGAFTGAVADRAGLFEEADGGTLFLDEVAELSARGQAKLLRVLQQQEVRRIGESTTRTVDVRLVAASNRDMRAEAAEGRFRQDLLYRLDVIRIGVPPLRDRPEDVALLAEHFWRGAAGRVGSSATLTHGVLVALTAYHWPGNVRELQNVMAALAVAAPPRGRVLSSLLPVAIMGATRSKVLRLAEARAHCERRCIEVALARAGGNRTKAAAQLGLSRQGLLKAMSRRGIEAK